MCKKILSLMFLSLITIIVLSAQSHPDRHSSVTSDAWLSCATSNNPNGTRGNSHWIRYDLGQNYNISNVDIWNFNHPDSLNMGVKDAYIDISLNGVTWTNVGQFTVPRANGSTLYSGVKAVQNLGFQQARYVLITPFTNYGGGSCFGIAEVQFNLTAPTLPVTISDLNTQCGGDDATITWKSHEEKDIASYEILGSDDANDWRIIKTVQPKGSGIYSEGLGQNAPYYLRVQAVEVNRNLITTDIVVNDCSFNKSAIEISPNPFSNQFTLSLLQSESVKPKNMRIIDITGKEVFNQTFETTGRSSFLIEPMSIIPGVYFVELNMYGDKKFVLRAVKI